MKETQRIFKLTDQEEKLLKEVIHNVRDFRNMQTDQKDKITIGKINIKIFNEFIEMESVNSKFKSFK